MPLWGQAWGEKWGRNNAMSQPTTISALKASFRTVIKAITPTHTPSQSIGWRYVDRRRDIAGSDIRAFHIQFGIPKRSGEGVQAPDAGEHEVDLRIWTSYAGLDEDYDEELIAQDAVDLETTLSDRFNLTDGLYQVTYEDWEADDDEGGRIYGAHYFVVTYLQSLS